MSKARNWAFTYYPEGATPQVAAIAATFGTQAEEIIKRCQSVGVIRFIVFGIEICPDTGRVHFQGYLQCKKVTNMKQLRELMSEVGLSNSHLEIAIKDAKTNIAYCEEDGVVYRYGTPLQQGQRRDLEHIKEMVSDGNNLRDIAMAHPGDFIRYHKGIEKYIDVLTEPEMKYEKVEVTVIVGQPGSGKTRYVYEHAKSLYVVPPPFNNTIWFDGYRDQEDILFDDFDGWVPFKFMLQLMDGYPMKLPAKGSFVHKRWKRVWITSNHAIETWYSQKFLDETNLAAFKRRILTNLQL